MRWADPLIIYWCLLFWRLPIKVPSFLPMSHSMTEVSQFYFPSPPLKLLTHALFPIPPLNWLFQALFPIPPLNWPFHALFPIPPLNWLFQALFSNFPPDPFHVLSTTLPLNWCFQDLLGDSLKIQELEHKSACMNAEKISCAPSLLQADHPDSFQLKQSWLVRRGKLKQ